MEHGRCSWLSEFLQAPTLSEVPVPGGYLVSDRHGRVNWKSRQSTDALFAAFVMSRSMTKCLCKAEVLTDIQAMRHRAKEFHSIFSAIASFMLHEKLIGGSGSTQVDASPGVRRPARPSRPTFHTKGFSSRFTGGHKDSADPAKRSGPSHHPGNVSISKPLPIVTPATILREAGKEISRLLLATYHS